MSFLSNKLFLNILACGLLLSSPFSIQGASKEPALSAKEQEKVPEKTEKWVPFSSPEEGFSVDLPTTPEHVRQSIAIPHTELKIEYNTYLSEPNEYAVYVISVWNYPAAVNMSRPDVNLQDGFEGMLSALPGSQVLNMAMTEVDGFKALEFLVKNDQIYFRGKLILVYNTLYQVFAVYKQKESMDGDFTHFMDSFSLIHPENRRLETPAPGSKNGEDTAPKKKVRI